MIFTLANQARERCGADEQYGVGKLTHTMIAHDLVDEFRILVFPFTFGEGPRIFEHMSVNTMKPLDTKTFSSGRRASLPASEICVRGNRCSQIAQASLILKVIHSFNASHEISFVTNKAFCSVEVSGYGFTLLVLRSHSAVGIVGV